MFSPSPSPSPVGIPKSTDFLSVERAHSSVRHFQFVLWRSAPRHCVKWAVGVCESHQVCCAHPRDGSRTEKAPLL